MSAAVGLCADGATTDNGTVCASARQLAVSLGSTVLGIAAGCTNGADSTCASETNLASDAVENATTNIVPCLANPTSQCATELASGAVAGLAVTSRSPSLQLLTEIQLAVAPGGQFTDIAPIGPARRGADGMIEVRLEDGGTVTTHGTDPDSPVGAPDDTGTPVDSLGTTTTTLPTRPVHCVTSGPAIALFYVNPKDKTNRLNASGLQDRLRTYVRQMSALLYSEANASSGSTKPANYPVLCNSSGVEVVRGFTSATTSAEDKFSTLASEVRSKFPTDAANPRKYLIFYDDPAVGHCGIGELYQDATKSATNQNMVGYQNSGVAVVYGNSPGRGPCWTRDSAMHEDAHTMGAVQNGAPSASGKGHCVDGLDVMCYADGGTANGVYKNSYCSSVRFDCRFNSYFDTATESGEWLATHWNLGWAGNKFLYLPNS